MSILLLESCPLCYSQNFADFVSCKDYQVSGENFFIQQCQNCKLLFTNPRPQKEILPKYYQSEKYISHTNKTNSLANSLYKLIRYFTLREKLRLVQRWSKGHILLDIGCGTGHFLQVAKQKGWLVEGVEISKEASLIAADRLKQGIYSNLADLSNKLTFQAITLWHVLEHVYDLNQTLAVLKRLLGQSGSLFIAVPNPKSYDAHHYGTAWAGWDVPRHLYHFTQQNIYKLARQHNFLIKHQEPMYLDAFYVSLLSESYQFKPKFVAYIQALLQGIRSNIWAKKHNNQYSSIIYVLQHA